MVSFSPQTFYDSDASGHPLPSDPRINAGFFNAREQLLQQIVQLLNTSLQPASIKSGNNISVVTNNDGTVTVNGVTASFTQTATQIANYTANPYEIVRVDTTNGAITITSPGGQPFGIRWAAGTIQPTIQAAANYTILNAATTKLSLPPGQSSGELTIFQVFGVDYQPVGGFKPTPALNAQYTRSFTPNTTVGTRTGFYDPSRNLYLPNVASMQKLRAKMDRALSLAGQVQMLCAGDSKTAGSGIGTVNSWPRVLKTTLSGMTFVGTGVCQAVWVGIDPTLDTRWSINSGTWTNGTSWLQTTSTNGAITFTSDMPGTNVDVFYYGNSATFTVSIDGAAAVTVNPNGAQTVSKYSVTGLSSATHTVKITSTTASVLYLIGVNVYPTTPGLMIHNAGIPGITSYGWTNVFPSAGFAALGCVPTPDIMILTLGANDTPNGFTSVQFKTNLTGILAAFNNPACLIVSESNTNLATSAQWAPFQSVNYDVADSYQCPLYDVTDRWGTSANAYSMGILQGDYIHESIAGHVDVARALARIIH